ncbi:MAG: helix-hairpin-helix domain-containing protein [Salinigranum sp.]
MGLLDTIKSLLGLDDSSEERGRRDTNVTVERDARTEPNTRTEAAVKGTSDAEIEEETAEATGSERGAPSHAERVESFSAGATTDVSADETAPPSEPIEDAETDADAEAPEAEAGTGVEAEAAAEVDDVTTEVEAATEVEEPATEAEEPTTAVEEAEDAEAETGEEAVGADVSVRNVKGIGPAYAERLADAGVDSVADLAAADADELAGAIDVSAKRIGRWIDRAREYEE